MRDPILFELEHVKEVLAVYNYIENRKIVPMTPLIMAGGIIKAPQIKPLR